MSPQSSPISSKRTTASKSGSSSSHKSSSSSSKHKLTSKNLSRVPGDQSNIEKYRQSDEVFERRALGMKGQRRDIKTEMREWERKYGGEVGGRKRKMEERRGV